MRYELRNVTETGFGPSYDLFSDQTCEDSFAARAAVEAAHDGLSLKFYPAQSAPFGAAECFTFTSPNGAKESLLVYAD